MASALGVEASSSSLSAEPSFRPFLNSLVERPELEPRFQRGVFAFKCVLMLSLAVALVALGQAVGWKELFEAM